MTSSVYIGSLTHGGSTAGRICWTVDGVKDNISGLPIIMKSKVFVHTSIQTGPRLSKMSDQEVTRDHWTANQLKPDDAIGPGKPSLTPSLLLIGSCWFFRSA